MAENKKSIVVYADWITKFEELEDDEAGKLIKHFFRYVNDLNPDPPDRLTKLLFVDIENQLKRDLIRWEKTLDERSYNGRLGNLKRWNLDLHNKVIIEELTLQEAENIAKHRKVSLPDEKASPPIAKIAVDVNVNDNVNDNVNVTVNEKEKLKILNSFLLSEIKISNDSNFLNFGNHIVSISEKEKVNFKTAIWFQKLFIKNLKEKNSPTATQEKAKYKNYVDPIRLMFEVDKVTQEQIKQAYEFLNSIEGEFWKQQILSTSKLREKIPQLLIQKNSSNGKQQQFASSTKKQARFSVARATEILRADAERKQREMENRNS